MNNTLLGKYINNQCTSNEIDEIFGWIEVDSDKISKQDYFENVWDRTKPTNNYQERGNSQQRLDSIHHKINLNQSEHLSAKKNHFFSPKTIPLIQWVTRAAVILLIPILTILTYTHYFQPESLTAQGEPQVNEIISPVGSRIYLELSDGTKVWLNHGSKMIYPQMFKGKSRTVKLYGEGYFDVAPNKAKPFIVETERMAIKAIGTSFNVKAYMDDTNFETTLVSGEVVLSKKTSGKNINICEMIPGQHFILDNKTNKFSLKTEDLTKYVSWKDGKLIFEDDTMDKVVERLSRWYNVEIILKDPELKQLTYTAKFVDESLPQILEMLEIVTPISFTVQERKKMTDGTFSKKKILIYRKI